MTYKEYYSKLPSVEAVMKAVELDINTALLLNQDRIPEIKRAAEEVIQEKRSGVVRDRTHRYKTMQQMCGITDGEICGDCEYFVRKVMPSGTVFKCSKWIMSNSAATDIRKKATACGKFRLKDREE